MKAVIQRVSRGKVSISGKSLCEISKGYAILLGIALDDTEQDARLLAEKTVNLRILADSNNKMNLSILQAEGEILVVSQFTLYADLTAGRRPSFLKSAKPPEALALYEKYIAELKKSGVKRVVSGEFGAYMDIELTNDGPVTIIMESGDFKKSS